MRVRSIYVCSAAAHVRVRVRECFAVMYAEVCARTGKPGIIKET